MTHTIAERKPAFLLQRQSAIRLATGDLLRYDQDVRLQYQPGHFLTAHHYSSRHISVLASTDPTPKWGPLVHVSLARKDRLPTWDEVKAVRQAFFPPEIDTMMVLPRESDYVNVHEFCFHIWQTPEEWGLQ